jgi:hypothetical protein
LPGWFWDLMWSFSLFLTGCVTQLCIINIIILKESVSKGGGFQRDQPPLDINERLRLGKVTGIGRIFKPSGHLSRADNILELVVNIKLPRKRRPSLASRYSNAE